MVIRSDWLSSDLVAGVTLAAYAIPVSLAYATLAGLPPQVGVYGYLMGGLGYALAGSSRYLAIGPTSAISLMIAGTVGEMAGDDGTRYAEIATAAAVGVGVFCLIAWVFRLSVLVKLISDSVLTGFKAGAGLTIAITQLPALLGVAGGGHNVPERLFVLAGQLDATNLMTLALGLAALALLWCGERWLPGRPVALGVVALSIIIVSLFELTRFKVTVTGADPTRTAIARHADDAVARSGRDRRAGHGMHAACLYRGRGGGTRIRDETPPDHRSAARAAGSGRGQHRNRGGRRLSR